MPERDACFAFGPYLLDPVQRLLYRDGELVPVSPRVFDTLLALVESGGELVSREALLQRIWPDTFVEEGNLSQNVFTLRRIFSEAGDRESYIETFPRRGYRFTAPVRRVPRRTPPARGSRVARIAGGLAAALAVLLIVWVALRRSAPVPSAATPGVASASLAVLPFRSVPPEAGTENRALGLGMADALIVRLRGIRSLRVRPVSELAGYADGARDAAAIAAALGIDWLLDGSLERDHESLRVTVQLLSAEDRRVVWAESFADRSGDIFALQDAIAARVAERLAPDLSAGERERLKALPTASSEAYSLYLEARYHSLLLTDHERAIAGFRQAVAEDPRFALAYSGLAFAYLMSNELLLSPADSQPLARQAALRALELDEHLTEARLVLAAVLWQYDWRPHAAELHFRRALEDDPRSATAHAWFAFFLGMHSRLDEARAEVERALELDPRSSEVYFAACPALFYARDFDQARELCRRWVELEPAAWLAHTMLGRLAEQQRRLPEALTHYRRAADVGRGIPETLMDLGRALGLLGRTEEARAIEAELDALAESIYVSPFQRAMVALGLGERERALELLAQAVEERSWYSVWLPMAPELDSLRSEPAFEALEARVTRVEADGSAGGRRP